MNLNEYLDQEESVQEAYFKVTDDSKANWALRKIKQNKEEFQSAVEIAEKETFKIESWLEDKRKKADENIDYFQSLLSEFALQKRDDNPDFKSMKLPNGTFRFRKQQPKFNYDDEKLVDYLKREEATELINVKETPNKSAVKKLFVVHEGKLINPSTGEVVEGVEIEIREDKFEVVTND